jgi:hypothetical protein
MRNRAGKQAIRREESHVGLSKIEKNSVFVVAANLSAEQNAMYSASVITTIY